jgi:BirA family transcriptional regulator, biotin operon repressor / biotin---[acetyl-CoA-carboxylase] ligase
MSDALPPDFERALAAVQPGSADPARVHYFAEVDSTNDIALSLAAAGAADGTAVLADLQRAGRGRRGRTWFSPPGAGLYLSIVVRPDRAFDVLSLVTLAAGVGAAQAVRSATALPVELKWPNDLVIGRPWRKLGGLLCESVGAGARVDAIVVGVGINLLPAAYPREIADRATSIEAELGRPADRPAIAAAVLAAVREAIGRLRHGDAEWVRREWRALGRAGLGGAGVSWHDQGRLRRGVARDIDADGALLVDSEGQTARLVAGEVTWERWSA